MNFFTAIRFLITRWNHCVQFVITSVKRVSNQVGSIVIYQDIIIIASFTNFLFIVKKS